MKLPVISGVIERRILVNFRVDPAVLAATLPQPFRPKLYRGMGLVGICLIRLGQVRPRFMPAWLGVSSENAAHRTAVEWDDHGTLRQGVYVRRRDTNSRLNTLVGGTIFPGIHSHAKFTVDKRGERLEIALRSDDGVTSVSVAGAVTDRLPSDSIFESLDAASLFFKNGSMGYSATPDTRRFEGMELQCQNWSAQPFAVSKVTSSYFENIKLFPVGSIAFDCALIMRNIQHEWHGKPDLCCEQ